MCQAARKELGRARGWPWTKKRAYAAVLNQGNWEAMKVFIGRMLQAAGRQVDDARLHVLAARATLPGKLHEAFEWLKSDVVASLMRCRGCTCATCT